MIAFLLLFHTLLTYAAPNKIDLKRYIASELTEIKKNNTSLDSIYSKISKEYGDAALPELKKIIHSADAADDVRYVSLFSLTKISSKDFEAELPEILKSNSWILRDGAVKIIGALGLKARSSDLKALLKDSSLIVRTSAVDAIAHLGLTELAPELVSVLKSDANYYRGTPLWIHKHVLTGLLQLKSKTKLPSNIVNQLKAVATHQKYASISSEILDLVKKLQ